MAVTRLERKGRKNKSRAKARVNTIKRLNSAPLIKNVDIEAIKAEFDSKNAPKKSTKKAEVKEEPVAVVAEESAPVVEEVVAEVSEEKVEKKAKAAPKKKAPAKKKEEE
ncbi:MAG: hypothetical protein JXR03_13780 [Cyclobacteriaceae bacterium]